MKQTKETDEELVQLAQAGDQQAYTALYARNTTYLRSIVGRILRGRPDDIEDAVQDAMAKSFTAIHSYTGEAKFRTWVHRIAVNEALTILRKRKASPLSEAEQIDGDSEDGEPIIQVADQERGYQWFEANSDLGIVLSRISVGSREQLEAAYLKEMRQAELAEVIGSTVSGIKSRTRRALMEAQGVAQEMALPVDKQQCVECKKESRFRFADKLVDGRPLCRWCTGKQHKGAAPVIRSGGQSTWQRRCKCCDHPFTATAANQRYIVGHSAQPVKPTRPYVRREEPKPDAEVAIERVDGSQEDKVDLRVTARAVDQLLLAFSTQDKVRALEFLLAGC